MKIKATLTIRYTDTGRKLFIVRIVGDGTEYIWNWSQWRSNRATFEIINL